MKTWMSRMIFVALITLLVLSGGVFSQNVKTLIIKPKGGELAGRELYTNSFAVIIGISPYEHLPKDKWLNFAHKDAIELRNVLVEFYGFLPENVTLLVNEQATKKNIEEALARLADKRRVQKNDRLFIFFSGHGQTVETGNSERGFLIPYDAEIDLGDTNNAAPYLRTCLPMNRLWEYVDNSPAKHALVMADACFSGLLSKPRRLGDEKPSPQVIARLVARPAKQVITAGSKDEEAVEKPELGHGAFTFKLLEELRARAANEDDVFAMSELAALLKTSVGNVTNGKQSPQFGNYDDTEGDFVFMTTPPRPVPPVGSPGGSPSQNGDGFVEVRTTPPGAKVLIDGQEVQGATTPCRIRVPLGTLRTRSVTVEVVGLKGYKSARRQVLLRRDETETVALTLAQDVDVGVRINPTDGAVMVFIPAEEFHMGTDPSEIDPLWKKFGWKDEWKQYAADESPLHRVRLDGFYMYRTEVTNAQFQTFVSATGYKTQAEKEGFGYVWNGKEWEKMEGADWRHPLGKQSSITDKMNHPVLQVSWNDAQAYCNWAGVRLPTEAEWEYAARGGNTGLNGKPRHTFVWGDEYPRRREANVVDESFKRKYGNFVIFDGYDDGYAETSPVGSFAPNGFGLFDMAGNALEWCADWYDENYYAKSPSVNPQGASSGQYRVLRGGSWYADPLDVRVADRLRLAPDYRLNYVGSRCVAVADFR